jgi:hypothetical protein
METTTTTSSTTTSSTTPSPAERINYDLMYANTAISSINLLLLISILAWLIYFYVKAQRSKTNTEAQPLLSLKTDPVVPPLFNINTTATAPTPVPKYFYAVKIGKVPGIYKSWEACYFQITGYKDALYKRFDLLQDALEYMEMTPEDALHKSRLTSEDMVHM